MKAATILPRISGERLRDAVPPPYRNEVVKGANPDGVYTLVLCPHDERDVVSSPTVVRALRKVETPAPDGILIVGAVFTEEALAAAAARDAWVVALRKAKWTDESARQRQL